jgi:hypothetical protein
MAHTSQSETNRAAVLLAGVLSIAGLATATIGAMYIAGMFGLSTAFASQIVHAVEVGGIALAIVTGLLSGGIAATVIATTRAAIARWGEKAAIA